MESGHHVCRVFKRLAVRWTGRSTPTRVTGIFSHASGGSVTVSWDIGQAQKRGLPEDVWTLPAFNAALSLHQRKRPRCVPWRC